VRKFVALAAALALVFLLSALPANAQVVVDRTAIALTYSPTGVGTSSFTASVSYRFDPTWDLLVGYTSFTPAATTFAFGGRYHLRPPSREFDVYLSAMSSSTAGISTILLGGGITQVLAPGLTGYSTLTYSTNAQVIGWDFGVDYQVSRQLSIVGGVNSGDGYLGVAYQIGR